MILVVDVCRERLHWYEFVKPVLDILKDKEVLVLHYLDLSKEDLKRCDRVIICGTSLADNGYLRDLSRFDWLRDFEKPVLGICAGFQILGLVVCEGEMKKNVKIGFFREEFIEEFLGLSGSVEVYHLHQNYINFSTDWKVYSGVEFASAVRWKNFYGVLFHPEVRNKSVVLQFTEL